MQPPDPRSLSDLIKIIGSTILFDTYERLLAISVAEKAHAIRDGLKIFGENPSRLGFS